MKMRYLSIIPFVVSIIFGLGTYLSYELNNLETTVIWFDSGYESFMIALIIVFGEILLTVGMFFTFAYLENHLQIFTLQFRWFVALFIVAILSVLSVYSYGWLTLSADKEYFPFNYISDAEQAYPGDGWNKFRNSPQWPDDCNAWFDGCNTCRQDFACTAMYCHEPLGEPRCLDDESKNTNSLYTSPEINDPALWDTLPI